LNIDKFRLWDVILLIKKIDKHGTY
jgi:hypothetical protein